MSRNQFRDNLGEYVGFLLKRLDHIIGWTQNATKLVYTVNGAILAAVYFGFGSIHPTSKAFAFSSILGLVLAAVNYLHANFLRSGYAWYRATEEEIRNVFVSMDMPDAVRNFRVGERQRELFVSDQRPRGLLIISRTHQPLVWLHLILSLILLIGAAITSFFAV